MRLRESHGMHKTSTYRVWQKAKERCLSPSHTHYENYGKRGISMCDEWVNSFVAFFQHMGERPEGKELDRIDNNLGYQPGNCRWTTRLENARNKRNTIRISAYGKSLTAGEWSDIYGVKPHTIKYRIKHGWDTESAVSLQAISGGHHTERRAKK